MHDFEGDFLVAVDEREDFEAKFDGLELNLRVRDDVGVVGGRAVVEGAVDGGGHGHFVA